MSITKTPTSMIDPSGATNEQVLTYKESISAWMPSDNMTNYTTVGNASAGIFASAVCFIPSDPGTGTWTTPAGCYTARVTLVGGGSRYKGNGGRSHFNYPIGSTTGPNQLFADGGKGFPDIVSGKAGWNGMNDLAVAGYGGCANGGCGGSGGTGTAGVGGPNGHEGGFSFGRIDPNLPSSCSSGGINGIGGSPQLSYAALSLNNFREAILQNVGRGGPLIAGVAGVGGGWCSAIVSVTPGLSLSYAVGAAGNDVFSASYGMVVIEW